MVFPDINDPSTLETDFTPKNQTTLGGLKPENPSFCRTWVPFAGPQVPVPDQVMHVFSRRIIMHVSHKFKKVALIFVWSQTVYILDSWSKKI